MEKANHTKICHECAGTGRVSALRVIFGDVGIGPDLIGPGSITCGLCQGMGTVPCRADGSIINR